MYLLHIPRYSLRANFEEMHIYDSSKVYDGLGPASCWFWGIRLGGICISIGTFEEFGDILWKFWNISNSSNIKCILHISLNGGFEEIHFSTFLKTVCLDGLLNLLLLRNYLLRNLPKQWDVWGIIIISQHRPNSSKVYFGEIPQIDRKYTFEESII